MQREGQSNMELDSPYCPLWIYPSLLVKKKRKENFLFCIQKWHWCWDLSSLRSCVQTRAWVVSMTYALGKSRSRRYSSGGVQGADSPFPTDSTAGFRWNLRGFVCVSEDPSSVILFSFCHITSFCCEGVYYYKMRDYEADLHESKARPTLCSSEFHCNAGTA